jgi:hypothetical protein
MPSSTLIASHQGLLYVADSRTPAIQILSLHSGATIRISFDEQESPLAGRPGARSARFDTPGTERRAEVAAEIRKQASEPLPYFDRLLPTELGVWLRDPLPLGDHTSPEIWTLVDSIGVLVGRLAIPAPPYDAHQRDDLGRPPPPPLRPILMAADIKSILLLRYDDEGAAHFSEYPLNLVDHE